MRRALLYLALLSAGGLLGYRMTRTSTAATDPERALALHGPGAASSPDVVTAPSSALAVDAGAAAAARTPARVADVSEPETAVRAPVLPALAGARRSPARAATSVGRADAGPRHAAFGDGACPAALFADDGAMAPGSDPFLEQRMQWLLADYDVPEGAIVALDPATGNVLAAAGHRAPGLIDRHLALEPRFPAASLFKIVSATALLEHGLTPAASICYHGGKRDVGLRQLDDNPGRDRSCAALDRAVAFSLNVPVAKWADRLLDVPGLAEVSRRFGFAAPATAPALRCFGTATLPDERLGFARTAAGFGEVRVSAWHAAVLAALVANRGVLPTSLATDSSAPPRLVSPAVAEQVAHMMAMTVREGTARRAFVERRRPVLGSIEVAGKTGSLVEGEGDDWGEVTWFAGFAPVDRPRVAVAAVIVNSPQWRIRASYAAREALRTALLHTEPYRPTQDPAAPEHARTAARH